VVEPSNSVRFSGLPNNATLEMVQTSKPRQETSINLGLQLESGRRLTHSFHTQSEHLAFVPSLPNIQIRGSYRSYKSFLLFSLSDTLWDVIKHWDSAGEPVLPRGSVDETESVQPVCVYMRQEIVGQEQLEGRTLRSLGLTHGSACIRYVIFYMNLVLFSSETTCTIHFNKRYDTEGQNSSHTHNKHLRQIELELPKILERNKVEDKVWTGEREGVGEIRY